MWHEARKQERRIRGMIVDYRKRAERRQDFYEKIQADPTQFIQVHGRRCKIHLDPAVAAAGDGAAIIVPWQGQQDNLIDRFDVRAHLDYIPVLPKSDDTDGSELSQEERQCNYERYRILAQNDFLNVPEEKFLHQLYLEEQFGANAQLEAERNASKKRNQKSGATIGYSYTDDADSSIGPQPFSHLMNVPPIQTTKPEGASDTDSDSDMDMDVSIDITKLDTAQAHELNSCGRGYGMLSNDFYSYLTKDADEADALRIAREEEQEKMLLSGRKSRRERRAQKERRIASRPFSPPSYAAKDDASGKRQKKDEESDSRSPSPADPNTGKITYITSFGGEDELQPHSKISINLSRGAQTLGESCVGIAASVSGIVSATESVTYAQKVKDNLEKLKEINKSSRKPKRGRESRSRSRSRSRGRRRRVTRRSRSYTRSSSRSRSYEQHHSSHYRYRRRSRSRGRHRRRFHSSSQSRSTSSHRTRSSKSTSSRSLSSGRYVRNAPQRNSVRRQTRSRSSSRKNHRASKSRAVSPTLTTCERKDPQQPKQQPQQQPVQITAAPSTPVKPLKVATLTAPPMISYPVPARITSPKTQVVEPPPPPLKRYYGRKRGKDSDSSSSSSSDSENKDTKTPNTKVPIAADENDSDYDDNNDVDTTSERSNPLATMATPSTFAGKQTGKQFSTAQAKSCPSYSNASEIKGYTGGSSMNLRQRLKRKMQSLLNKQYKADKRAEIEKSERERQLQQEREDEMRELALKLRRRQRELRHKYGTPSTGKSSSDSEEIMAQMKASQIFKRSKSRSSECLKVNIAKLQKPPQSHTHTQLQSQLQSHFSKHGDEHRRRASDRSASRERRRSRSRSYLPGGYHARKRSTSRSPSRSRFNTSRRRLRSTSRGRRQRDTSYDDRDSSRYRTERSSHNYDNRRRSSRSRQDQAYTHADRERHRERTSDRCPERDRPRYREKERDYREMSREREKNRFRADDRSRVSSRPSAAAFSSTITAESATSSSHNRVVISAPPKLKKLVDY